MSFKRFLTFGFDTNAGIGGWNDFLGSFDTEAQARKHLKMLFRFGNYQIVDTETQEVHTYGKNEI